MKCKRVRNTYLLACDSTDNTVGFGATGKFWGHEHWQLLSPPDIVTFSKKAQTAGYFFSDKLLRPDKPYRQFNT
jgi:4-aminobutyrate aminotransferase/(S)-3-amino-2-methylpropionate transaminase